MHPSDRRFPLVGGLFLVALLCASLLGVPTANAATLTVTTTADGGAGSLRAALAAATDGDTVQFDPALNGQTITLTSGQLNVDKNLTISGPGADLLTITRNQQAFGFRIFNIPGEKTVVIEGLTIMGGYELTGGGILNGGTLTITDSVVTGNRCGNPTPGPSVTPTPAGFGGGIANWGTALTIRRSTVSDNLAAAQGYGGGINGPVTITESIITNNHSDGDGGGISSFPNNQGTITITNSTIDGNTAASDGGGIHIFGGLSVENSTIRNNQASNGGGIYNTGFGVPVISNSTINNNTAASGGGIFSGGIITNSTISDNTADWGAGVLVWFSQMTITNSTFAGNSSSQHGSSIYNRNVTRISNTILNTNPPFENIYSDAGSVDSHGYNLSSDNGGGFLTATGDQINTNPMLGPLQNNGGPTATHDLLLGSPAINAGAPNFTPPPFTDQRGYPRVFNGRIDIGSVEAQPAPTPTPPPTPTPSPATPTPTPGQCAYIFLDQNFNGVTAPVLPPGWVSTFTSAPGACMPTCTATATPVTDWTTTTINPASPPNCAFHEIPACAADTSLYSPLFHNGVGSDTLTFQHSFNMESGRDGAVLEISINGGPFTDFIAAGGTFAGGTGYNGTIGTTFQNPLAGRQAWTGDSGGYRSVFATMPPQSGNVVLRFRIGTGCGGATGWRLDDIRVVFLVPCPTPTPTPVSPTPTPTPTPSCPTVITESTSQAITTPCPACFHPPPMYFPHPNSYWRAFNMQSFVGGAEFTVSSVSFGVFSVGGGDGTVVVELFANNGAPFPAERGTLIGTSTLTVTPGQGGTIVTTPLAAIVPAGTIQLVMEVYVPEGGPSGPNVGANTAPESGPSYWSSIDKASACSSTPQVIASHLVFNVHGTCSAPAPTATPTPTPTPCSTTRPGPAMSGNAPGPAMSGTVVYCSNPVPAPVPGVTILLNYLPYETTGSDGQYFIFFKAGCNCRVTPSKADRTPASPGINTVDAVAVERHFLMIGTPLSGCRLTAADVNGDASINTIDVIAIQRFFLGFSTGIANVGKYQFNPHSRCYTSGPNQDFDTLVFGDVAMPFIY